ncbi:hypothetical protein [Comamonas sp.]|uniref:hypothetical protein n=1 Tax=Comamonas sp. TaxID=34028 RepID=UPI002898B874|nr:hypothetical protein [Comamonas sp.]
MSATEPVWRVAPALLLAQLQATLARLDGETGNACIRLYSTPRPEGMGQGAAPMAQVQLARPAGVITAQGLLQLTPADTAGAMVLESGTPRWGELVAADGAVLADGNVTDAEHGGCFQVSGGQTPEGDDAPVFYAGGLITLAATALG